MSKFGGNRAKTVNDGDWICSSNECGNINFSWRVKCNKCGRDKGKVEIFKKTGSEIGKKAAERSGGLFSAEDWHCSSCGNVNWARRSDCNVCNTPKYGTVEPRTGLGGGYNERENVEYIDREESDNEYDDFGRLRKKTRNTKNNNEVKHKNSTESRTSVGDPSVTEEEKEDSGEEFDLSKYDLAGDNDDEEEDDNGRVNLSKYDMIPSSPKARKSQSRSRSRGRNRGRSPKVSSRTYVSRSSRSHSRSPVRKRSRSLSRSHDVKRRTINRYSRSRSRDYSRSPIRKWKSRSSRSRSYSKDRRNSRSRSKSRERYPRKSRSNSRDRTRDRRAYRRSYSRSRSRSRERRRGYHSRSHSRERYR